MEEDYFVKEEMIPDEFPSVMEEEEETESIIEDSKELIMDSEQNLTQQKAIIPFELCMIKEEQLSGTEDNEDMRDKLHEYPEVGETCNQLIEELPTQSVLLREPTLKERWKRKAPEKKGNKNEGDLLRCAKTVLHKTTDDYHIFGKYVAMELRNLKYEMNKRKLQSTIRKAIVYIADEDDNMSFAAFGISSPLTSHRNPSAPSK